MRPIFFLYAMANLVSCSEPPTAPAPSPQASITGCKTDDNCKGERICVAGSCVDPSPKVEPKITKPEISPPKKIVPAIAPKEEKEKAEEEDDPFKKYRKNKPAGTVEDKGTGWVWASSDNGTKVTWNEALELCVNKGRGWRLPSVDELKTLYENGNSTHSPKEEPTGLTITHPSEFSLSGYYLWAKSPVLVGNNMVVDLHDGKMKRSEKTAYALCIQADE